MINNDLHLLLCFYFILNKQEYGVMKGQLNFVLRDTPNDFINVSCWGSENFIGTLSDSFYIGSVSKFFSCFKMIRVLYENLAK